MTIMAEDIVASQGRDCRAIAEALVPALAERAAAHDADDSFVADGYARLRAAGLIEAGVPAALGGAAAGFHRAAGLERGFRDVPGARYHPLQAGPQAAYAGAMALGLPVAAIY